MKYWMKIVLVVTLSLLCCFTSLGYAQVTSELRVIGTAQATPPKAVFITSVTTSGENGGSAVSNGFSLTVLNSTVNLGENGNATATFNITVYNNTDITHGYNAMIYTVGEGTYDNTNMVVTPNIERRTPVEPGEYLTFTVTVTYDKKNNITDTVLNSVINYEFLPLDDIPEDEDVTAVSGVLEQFRKILNNEVVGIDNSYQVLMDQMNDAAANDRNSSYIGTVDGASDADVAELEYLFQGQLSLTINGTETPVTLMIKNENVDGVAGNEMVIYMTTDDLIKTSYWRNETAVVYVAVFKNTTLDDGTAKWIQIGDMYEGEANIVQYSGWMGNGSFNTDTWVSTNNKTIEQIIQALN